MIAFSSSKFLKTAYRNGFFESGVSQILRRLGYGMVIFYCSILMIDYVLPWIITKNLAPELQVELEWFPLDATIVALLVGFILLILSGAMEEAREIDTDNKQFI